MGQINREALDAEVEEEYKTLKDQPPHTPEQIASIKRVLELHLVTFKYYDFEKTKALVHQEYKQHSYMVGDGPNSIIDAAKEVRSWAAAHSSGGEGEPHVNISHKRILLDGPYIIVHHHATRWEGDYGQHVIDMYRIKEGKFVEHWDIQQEVPAPGNLKHSNGIF